MEVIRGLDNLIEKYPVPVVTLGNFDGVHTGHRRILERVRESAQKSNGTSIVITFEPHPLKIVNPQKGIKILTPFDIKAELIEKAGMDVLLCIEFNKRFSSTEPDFFVENVLVGKLNASHVIVGHNYRFGKGKKGTTESLRRRGKKYGFTFQVVRNVKRDSVVISSSVIRHHLIKGDMAHANCYLGRPYFIQSEIITGTGRGKSILHIPTANLSLPDELVPRCGVYAVKVQIDGHLYDGAANIGSNPTFGENPTSYEVHAFGYEGNAVGKTVRVHFIERLRDERVFPSPDALREQIMTDFKRASEILKKVTLNQSV
ncbi:MAG: bifunctional riboflavin kinase/FAD synthetase [Nitrospirae bacterium]|nr:bifunctional riboflavin kinase/FAD synthetase [Nitrospirota bacterium]MBF0533827.1 bifunctional riboflavin kinase/FAD synthetase [Nitrospirota bacterium]MBF0615464.1 bifunctional riboflavin kinase/FAD synthetase [Nitrospirota bacterium]